MKKDVLSLVRMRKKLLFVVLVYILGASTTGNHDIFSTSLFCLWQLYLNQIIRNGSRLIIQLLFLVIVRCGNYYPCSWNPCKFGHCVAMYPSPNLQAYVRPVENLITRDIDDSIEEDIFFTSPAFSRWEDASEYCISNDASLLDMSINTSILRYIPYKY